MEAYMFTQFKKMALIAVVIGLSASQAHAAGSGGFRVELTDAEALAKGDAFVGEADNPSAVYFNPAGITQLKGENHISVGGAVLAPSAQHTSFSGVETQMVRQNFYIPNLFMVTDFNTEKWAFGVGGTSNWGTATDFSDDSFSRYVATQSDLRMIDSMITAAYMANEQWSFALSANNVYSTVNKSKKLLQTGGADGDFQLKATDQSWGYRVAAHYKMNDQHRFGLMYRSPIQLKYRGKAFLHGLNNSGSNYAGIFGSDHFETNFSSELQLPQSVVLGYSYKPNTKWTFNIDTEWMDWSSVEQEWVEYTEVLSTNQAVVLNTGNPVDRDWNDVFSVALGAEYALTDHFRLRGGAYYHNSPIPDANIDSSLPDANKLGATTGFGLDITDDLTIDLAYSALFYENFTLDNAVGNAVGGNIDGKYEQIMHMGVFTLTYDF